MALKMFALALLSFVVLCFTHQVVLGVICVVLTVGFIIAGMLQIVAARMGDSSRDSGHIVTPEELRLYREQAQARKQAAEAAKAPSQSSSPSDPSSPA